MGPYSFLVPVTLGGSEGRDLKEQEVVPSERGLNVIVPATRQFEAASSSSDSFFLFG